MIVKWREWISKGAQEAILTIGDGGLECVAFSHPCKLQEGECLREPLLAISIKGIAKEQLKTRLVMRHIGNSFAHEVLAEVVDVKRRLVVVGSIFIELDDVLPGDISGRRFDSICL
ncbi:hypothetical protein [Pseudomonas corrugata]